MSNEKTSLTMIDELCQSPDEKSWQRLLQLYSPLLNGWLRRYEVQDSDADDLIQEVLIVVMRELPNFRHNRQTGAFRSWLRHITVNRLRNSWREREKEPRGSGKSDLLQQLDELEDNRSPLSRIWEQEHDRHVTRKLLELVEPRFTENTLLAFRRLVLEDANADDVAAELDMSLNAVFTAKSRVLRELRRLGKGLID